MALCVITTLCMRMTLKKKRFNMRSGGSVVAVAF